EEDSGAVFGAADTDRVEGAFRVGFLGCFDLQAERNPMPLLFNAQLVSVEPLFELRGVGVEKPGDRCDRDEWCDEDSRIEVQARSEEHTSELQSRENLVCRLL